MYGHTRETLSFASAGSYSTGVKVQGAKVLMFELPATGTLFATKAAQFTPQMCKSSNGTFRDIVLPVGSVSGLTTGTFVVTAGSGGYNVVVNEMAGANYVRLKANTAATDGYTPFVHTFQQ